jgi:capsular polysaccharide transport system ATP-binding protein
VIKVDGLTKSYVHKGKRVTVFKDLSFQIEKGESIALLGRNGAGKTTLLRLLGGIDVPDRGTIERNGSISWPVGLTGGFQGSLSARENLTFVSKIYTPSEYVQEKIRYVEEFAEIGEYFDRPFKTYSSGMRSRVAFGLSMAFDFDVYLMDEISSAGDERFRAKSRKILQEKHEKADFIMVDHNLLGLKFHCNRAFLLHEGVLLQFDSLQEGIEMHKKLLLDPPRSNTKKQAGKVNSVSLIEVEPEVKLPQSTAKAPTTHPRPSTRAQSSVPSKRRGRK